MRTPIEILLNLFRRIVKREKNIRIEEYIEKDTECDLCEHKQHCIDSGDIVFSTLEMDTREHYIKGIGCVCYKNIRVYGDYMVSQLIEIAEQNRDALKCDRAIDMLKRAYKKHGDMKFKDMIAIISTEEI